MKLLIRIQRFSKLLREITIFALLIVQTQNFSQNLFKLGWSADKSSYPLRILHFHTLAILGFCNFHFKISKSDKIIIIKSRNLKSKFFSSKLLLTLPHFLGRLNQNVSILAHYGYILNLHLLSMHLRWLSLLS